MLEKENLKEGVISGILISLAIGIIISIILKPALGSIILILSIALLPGFFISTLLYLYKISKEKQLKSSQDKKFDWGVEINLRKLQILHNKYASLLQVAGLIATGSFISMVYLARDFPAWQTGHMIFFPISTVIFIFSLHFAFRWWFAMRSDQQHLRFEKLKP